MQVNIQEVATASLLCNVETLLQLSKKNTDAQTDAKIDDVVAFCRRHKESFPCSIRIDTIYTLLKSPFMQYCKTLANGLCFEDNLDANKTKDAANEIYPPPIASFSKRIRNKIKGCKRKCLF